MIVVVYLNYTQLTLSLSILGKQKGRARVEEEKTDETINPEINPEILRIHADMSRVISAAEEAGLEGNIDLVQVSPFCTFSVHYEDFFYFKQLLT